MGGLGSGAHRQRYARKTDELLRLDLADLRRWGVLDGRHASGTLKWSRGGTVHSSIGYRFGPDALALHYHERGRGETEWRHVGTRVPWRWSGQPIGESLRRWFGCPHCDRRCRVLYGTPFACVRCHRLVYESQYEPIRVPGLAAVQRTRERLGGDGGMNDLFPPKPKGMH